MPGSPATSTRFGAPRYSNADAVDFAGQVNAVTDMFDAKAALAIRPIVTALPTTSLVDGMEVLYRSTAAVVGASTMATLGILWPLRYNAGSASTYKWEAIGAGEIEAEVITQENLAGSSTTYTNLATAGPQITVPNAGEYSIRFGAEITPGGAIGNKGFVAPAFGASAPSANDEIGSAIPVAQSVDLSASRSYRRTVSAAAQVVKLQYKVSSTTNVLFAKRYLIMRPIRII